MMMIKCCGVHALRIAVGITMLGLLLAGSANAANLTVCPSGCAYSIIQKAIDTSSNGDTILVKSGTYFENVNVNKQLTLRGIGNPVVDAGGSGSAITLSANGITLEGFTATGGGSYPEAGIKVTSSNNTLSGNNASNNGNSGIALSSSSNNTLSGNNASNNGNSGIALSSSSNNTLSDNNASNTNTGIYLLSSSNNTLSDNNASNNNIGIYLLSSSNNTLSGNMMTGNQENFNLDGGTGSDLDNHIDTGNLVDGRPIYYIIKASDMTYDSSSNAGTFYCISCVNVTIKNLNLNKNSKGIYFWNTSHSRIQNVNVSNNGYGILLVSSSNNTLSGNNANSNTHSGIYLSSSSNNTLTGNNANSNRFYLPVSYGILLASSSNNTLNRNNASNNNKGIYLDYSSDNTLSGNNASNNYEDGISLSLSSNNNIYNNYFSNTNNAFDDGNNRWNIKKTSGTNIINGAFSGGNFWSDYAGNDINGDGLGDTMLPYNSSKRIANGGDYLPLIHFSTPSLGTLNITSFSPTTSTVTNNVGDSRTFNVTTNQTVNVSWLINETEVFNETGVTTSSYTNSNAALGTWNVIAIAQNANGTVSNKWTWIVAVYLKGDLNGNGIPADAGDLVLMKRASIGEIQADSKYDLNNNGQLADAGDLVLMKRASIGEINL